MNELWGGWAVGTYGVSRVQADSTHERVVKKEDGERLAKVRLKYKHIKHRPDVTVGKGSLTFSLCRVLVLSLCVSGTVQPFYRLWCLTKEQCWE